MSVYKSKRGESAMQFVETARQLEAHTFACCMKTPKRYSFLLTTRIMETGKVVRKMNRKGTRKMREKLKKFRARMDAGAMTEEDIRTAYESWRGHMRRGDSWRAMRRMDKYYKSLYT